MIVALGTFQGNTQHSPFPKVCGPVYGIHHPVFFIDGTGFFSDFMIPVKACGQKKNLFLCRIGKQVACQLPGNELVNRACFG